MRRSADTLVANVAQQASALLLFVTVPNILPVGEYALVVIATVILGFVRFPDLGLSLVYGRDAPALHAGRDPAALEAWNRTIFWFGIVAGCGAGALAGAALYLNGARPTYCVLLALLPPMLAAASAYVSFAAAAGDFRGYRDVQLGLALARLLVIPGIAFLGLGGWFLGQLAAGIAAFGRLGVGWIPRPARIDWAGVRGNLPAAIQLALITVLWTQLLDSARLFAAIHYERDAVATYGIIVAGYQSAYNLVIAAFLPISVRTFELIGRSDREAAQYVQQVIRRSLVPVFLLTIVAAELAPYVLRLLFPRYDIDALAVRLVVYGLSAMPVVATVGNLLVGKKCHKTYFLVLIAGFAVTAAVETLLRPHVAMQSAAYGQLAGTLGFAAMLLFACAAVFRGPDKPEAATWLSPVLWLCFLWMGYLGVRYLATIMWP